MSSVRVRKRGNYYEYTYDVGVINGKRKRISKSGFRTKAEAQESGISAYNEFLNTGLPFKEKELSYSDYLDYWYDNYCVINLRYNTRTKYKILIEKYIKPELGYYRISTITSFTLNNYLIKLFQKYNFARSYFSNILKVIKSSFKEACNAYGFLKYNPTIGMKLPRTDEEYKDVKHVYTQEEIDKILNRFKDNDAFTCAFLTSCYTGMRTGEVFALTWEDIDFENRIINISKNVYDKPKDVKGRWYIGNTKTRNGTRQVYMNDTLYSALLNYKNKYKIVKKLYGSSYKSYYLENVDNKNSNMFEQRIILDEDNIRHLNSVNFVFTKEDGTYVGKDIIKYPFKVIRDELGIKARFYDLRGSYATKMLRSGAEIKDVAGNLGHGHIETTENYYVSTDFESRKNANIALGSLIGSEMVNSVLQYKI